MTECERFIREGSFTSDFFRPEVRCDFLVDEKRKKVWAVELDMLSQFDEVCKIHGLRYFAFVGTLLGAVRHKGFVPWDDDIDLVMPRKDYEQMLKLGSEFCRPLFLQTPWTDPGYAFSFSKVRNGNTSFVSKKFRYEKFNQGIMLDFHPLDVWCPNEDGERIYNDIAKLSYDNSTHMRLGNPELDAEDRERVSKYKICDPQVVCERIRDLGMTFAGRESTFVCRNTFALYGYRRNVFFAEDFSAVTYLDFEGVKIPAPKGYDRILTTLYGDYMKLPPVEKRGQWHSDSFVDPDKPYTHYLKQK